MFKTAVTMLIAASAASATWCGGDGQRACEGKKGHFCVSPYIVKDGYCVPYNAPTSHSDPCDPPCDEEVEACWEGVCMDCGGDGKPVCKGDHPCDDGLEFSEDGTFCQAPRPPSHVEGPVGDECTADDDCTQDRYRCWEGYCMPCGMDGKPKCLDGHACNQGTLLKDGWCVNDPNYGW